MKKFLFILFFLTAGISLSAQFGIGLYPLGNEASVRWNPNKIVRDSSGAHFVTDYNFHIELRSSFSFSHNTTPVLRPNQRRTTINAQPEVAFFHHFAGKTSGPMLFSGGGAFVAISHNGVNSVGVFIPLLMEYIPSFNFTHNICFDLETDLVFTGNDNGYNTRFRPMLSVAWIFSPPSPKKS